VRIFFYQSAYRTLPLICVNPVFLVWSGAFAAIVYNQIFPGYQPRQMVKIRKHRRFKGHHCPRPQGSEVVEIPNRIIYVPAQPRVHGCVRANGDWWVESWTRLVFPRFPYFLLLCQALRLSILPNITAVVPQHAQKWHVHVLIFGYSFELLLIHPSRHVFQ
jgi:hypothetical protein